MGGCECAGGRDTLTWCACPLTCPPHPPTPPTPPHPLPPPSLQLHAIATFNALVAEGRRVAVALVSRVPVSRDDACLYTPEWAQADALRPAGTRRAEDAGAAAAAAEGGGAALRQALARDYSGRTDDVGGGGGDGPRLLTGGGGAGGPPAAAPPRDTATAVAAAAAAGWAPARPAAGAAPPHPAPLPRRSARVEAEAAALAVRYGYPGALPPDVSLVMSDEERAALEAGRVRRVPRRSG